MNQTLEAEESLCIKPKQPFSWSYFRHTLFKRCQRAYFYHYYGSQDGWDEYADPRSRQIHKLKSIKTIDLWLEDVLKRSLREALITPHRKNSPETVVSNLKRTIHKHINAEHREYSAHEWDDDHRSLNLFETYYELDDVRPSVHAKALNKLNADVDLLAKTAIFEELCAVNYYQWKTFTPPIYAYLNRKQVWTAPVLIWHSRTGYNVLNLRLSSPCDDYPLSLGVAAIYLAQRAAVAYSNIQCRKMYIDDSIEIFNGHCDINTLLALIESSSADMKAKMTDANEALESNFQKCTDTSSCTTCNFKEVCWAE